MPSPVELNKIFAYDSYHAVHYPDSGEQRYKRSLRLIRQHAPEVTSILDFGCGNGEFLRAAAARGYECAGIEYEAEAIARAEELSGAPVTTLEDALAAGRRFDLIRLSHVLVALPDPRSILDSIAPLLRPRGTLVIETAVENNPSIAYWSGASIKWIERKLGLGVPARRPPTLLWRTDWATMRTFFSKDLRLHETYAELFDDGWPLWAPGSSVRGPRQGVKGALGRLAAWISDRRAYLSQHLGNQTVMLFKPRREREPTQESNRK